MIEATAISHRYGDRWIFREVTLALEPGEVLAVLGPNARGKTTMIKCLAGLMTPTSGRVRHGGAVGYVPQSHSAPVAYPVREMVLMGRARHIGVFSTPSREDRRIAAEALARVGLDHLADRPFTRLSGGERQMVLIARALASGCQTLVLDEPASALDLRNQGRVLAVLSSLAEEGMTVVMTTHHPDHALRIADRTMLIVDADDVRIGATTELLTGDTLTELYGLPISTIDVPVGGREERIVVPDFGVGAGAR
ncbi:iron complex transport system ATP-binding protein [Pseudonocardia thermophila]|uniref:Iron complex transport system ATP-binding protein n=1 Tax=Pseudonocardia thermophila TaxID=1848 RepID=A0A1M6PFT8_PSETH|nr:ABC transporter ATP-binding protein [Pseudonocardia thermophila]SHK06816.1 iron complex transport system ATP-binding protein [Pseudonocardia thermophila]